jgi:quinol-cytochrome oxidoreductase complex cytochrome b subunit
MGTSESNEDSKGGVVARLVNWFDARMGLSHEMFRPAPRFSINPFYWLGALAVVAFIIQGVSGIMMMLYYVPTPSQAYSSTLYIFQNVSYGQFLETVHLYTAYAMIMLAFMHMMRSFFVSVHKKPRELMWVVGMGMGFVTLGFGFTGYLLPWTVVSKSATDVGIGMVAALPPPIASWITFLISGSGADAAVILRFYDLHVVVLPAVLLLLLAVKMYMLETHGVADPARGMETLSEKKKGVVPIFPDVTFYLLELAAIFGSAMMLLSIAFPLNLPPEYTPLLASQYVSQPDWYFLWIYQILKIEIFEGPGLTVALGLVSVIFIALIVLPFIDRGNTRSFLKRKRFVTLGLIFVAEVVVLTVWGLLTPGRIIQTEQAILVLGGTALVVALASAAEYRVVFPRLAHRGPAGSTTFSIATGSSTNTGQAQDTLSSSSSSSTTIRSASLWQSGMFSLSLGVSVYFIAGTFNAMGKLMQVGASSGTLFDLVTSLSGVVLAALASAFLLYRLELGTGMIKRRVRAFEIGWRGRG